MGAHFEALDEGVLMAVLKSFEHFFAISNSAAALWVVINHTCLAGTHRTSGLSLILSLILSLNLRLVQGSCPLIFEKSSGMSLIGVSLKIEYECNLSLGKVLDLGLQFSFYGAGLGPAGPFLSVDNSESPK